MQKQRNIELLRSSLKYRAAVDKNCQLITSLNGHLCLLDAYFPLKFLFIYDILKVFSTQEFLVTKGYK
jgi:hypothetical protein